jgi:mannose-6-phosphate isomerase-like protein (cupin superfamily)
MSDKTAEEQEAFHRAAEARIESFAYHKPANSGRPKDSVALVRSGMLKIGVQAVYDGGENNLHYHTANSETAWMVLKGRVRFYGVDDVVLGEYGPHEGIFLPGGSRYWFEKVGDDDLEILQMVGISGGQSAKRINVDRHKSWMNDDDRLTIYKETAGAT